MVVRDLRHVQASGNGSKGTILVEKGSDFFVFGEI